MKKIVCFLILVLTVGVLQAQPPKYFYAMYGGDGDDVGMGVQQIAGGDYVVVGSTTSFGNGQTDVYLLYIDQFGEEKWHKTFGGSNADVGKKIVVDPADSSYLIAGYSNSTDSTGFDAYVLHVAKNGSLIWERRFGGKDWEFANDLVLGSDGSVLVVGSGYSKPGFGKRDAIVWKVDVSSGNLIWDKHFGGLEDDEFNSIRTKTGSTFFLCGTTGSFGEPNGDIFFYKIDLAGDSLLAILYGGPSKDKGNDVLEISNGDIILVGGSLSFTNGKSDAFYAKFSPTGNFKWRKNRGLAGDDEEIFRVVRAQTPNLEEAVIIFSTKESIAYKNDIKTIFFNYDGDYYGGFDSGKFGFPEDDEAFDLALCIDKGYIEVGYFTDTTKFDKDVFLIKLDTTLLEKSYLPTAIVEQSASDNTGLYPNPCSASMGGEITVSVGNKEQFFFAIYEDQGSFVKAGGVERNGTIDVSHLKPGIYLCQFRADTWYYCKRFVVIE